MTLYEQTVQLREPALGEIRTSVHVNHNDAWAVLEQYGWQRTGAERDSWIEWGRPSIGTSGAQAVESTVDAFRDLYRSVDLPASLGRDDTAARAAVRAAHQHRSPATGIVAPPPTVALTPRTSHTAPSIEGTGR